MDATTDARQSRLESQPSELGSVGVEIEFPILDRDTGELAPGAGAVLEICRQEGVTCVGAELMQSMIELRGGPSSSVKGMRPKLLEALRRLRNAARSKGYELAMIGAHPFQRPSQHALSPHAHFEKAREQFAWLVYNRVAFGLHVHVGLADGEQLIGVMTRATAYLPHLLALSANSPSWHGIDTGLASCRAAMYPLVPHSGIPPTLNSWKDFRTYYQVMCDSGAGTSVRRIKWDLRPRPDLGTLEFRICDVPDSLARVFAIVALAHCLVVSLARLLGEKPEARRADWRRHWFSVENRWNAARYGLHALNIRAPSGKRRPLLGDLEELIERLLPIARETGDHVFLEQLKTVDAADTGADRQRKFLRETGGGPAMMRCLITSFNEQIDAEVVDR